MNEFFHQPLLELELKKLLAEGSFSSISWRTIGSELHYRLVDWPDETETEYSRMFPVDALFLWVSKDGGLDAEWLATEDGHYLDDDGFVIPPTVKPSYSAVEQLAAYGLWLISEYVMGSYGAIPKQGANENGFNRDEVIEHRAACMLLAYQAIVYCQRVLHRTKLSGAEKEQADKLNFSALGKAGAARRHAPMTTLRAWAIEEYHAGEWKSANQAAHALKDSVIKHGRTINAHLSEENAQRTIAEWFRKSV